MHAAVNCECAPLVCEHFALYQVCRIVVALLEPPGIVGPAVHQIPVNRRISEQNTKPTIVWQRCVHSPDSFKQTFARSTIALRRIHLRRVAPQVGK